MSDAMLPGDRRAISASLAGMLIQLVLFGVVLAVGLWGDTRSDAVVAGARHLLGGLPIWIILVLVFRQRRLSRLEDLETERLKRAEAAGLASNIFEAADESILLERRRLAWTYKFLLPLFTILLIVYHLAGTFIAWTWPMGRPVQDVVWKRAPQPLIAMIFMAATAFVCFVFARYVIGMSRQPGWRLLRAGGSYLIGNALTATLLVVAMALAGSETTATWAEPLAAYVIRLVLVLLGMEMVVNFVLEFYRPRRADDEVRPAFDSRVLALFSEPGGVVRSIAETVNYQFGFEVSRTWFYQLIQRSVFPLATLTVVALILLSSIVVVDVDEQAYVERFGRVVQAAGQPIEPGFSLKFPWPIDRVMRARVDQVRSTTVGTEHQEAWKKREHAAEFSEETVEAHALDHAVLWTEEHEHLEPGMLVVVANPDVEGPTTEGAASDESETSDEPRAENPVGGGGVSLLMASAAIQYRINNLHQYLYGFREPERVLESIAYQELSDYSAGNDASFMMGPGRETFSREMRDRLQRRCDALGLGITITLVGLHAHPPSSNDVAATYQAVIAAEIRKEATIEHARGAYSRILTLAAGGLERAKQLDAAIQAMDKAVGEAERLATPQARTSADSARQRVEELLLGNKDKGVSPASGQVAAVIDDARAAQAQVISDAESKLRSFESDLSAYRAAPELFKTRRYLATLRAALPGLRKFVFTGDPQDLIVEYETKQRATLDLETVNPSADTGP